MDLNSLRPENTTAAAIAAALKRAEAAQAEADQAVADAKARRDTLLLDGSPTQLAAAEKLLTAARELGERVEAMQQQLRQRLAAAERVELLARLSAAKKQYQDISARRAAWWDEAEPVFRDRIIERMRLDSAAHSAMWEWNRLQQAAAQRYPADAGTPDYPQHTEPKAKDWSDRLVDALRGTMTAAELQSLGV